MGATQVASSFLWLLSQTGESNKINIIPFLTNT